MSAPRPLSDSEKDLNRAVKLIEWWPLVRGVIPLIAVSASLGVLYLVLGLSSDQEQVLYGVPLLAGGLVCAVIGFRRRLREMRTSDNPNTHGYGLIFLGWALTLVGLVLPWYLVA